MEDYCKGKILEDKDILFSKVLKAGKRIYYVDVRQTKSKEIFLIITESKKVREGRDNNRSSFEKHKIFLRSDEIDKLLSNIEEAVDFIKNRAKMLEGVKLNKSQQQNIYEAESLDKRAFIDQFTLNEDF